MTHRLSFALLSALVLFGCSMAAPVDEVLDTAEVPPALIGGLEALVASIPYPDYELRAGIAGNVTVQCIVRQTGVPTNVEVVRSVSPGLDRAAVNAVAGARFVPGQQDGQAVAVRFLVPIAFRSNIMPPPITPPPPPPPGAPR